MQGVENDWLSLMKPTRGENVSSGQRRRLAHLGMTRSHPCIRNPATYIQLQPGDKTDTPRVDTALQTVKTRTPRAHFGLAGLAESARGENFLPGQLQGPATPGEDTVASLDQKSFHTFITPTARDENGHLQGRCRHARCGNPNPTA